MSVLKITVSFDAGSCLVSSWAQHSDFPLITDEERHEFRAPLDKDIKDTVNSIVERWLGVKP